MYSQAEVVVFPKGSWPYRRGVRSPLGGVC